MKSAYVKIWTYVLALMLVPIILMANTLSAQTTELPIVLNEIFPNPQSAPFDAQFIEVVNLNAFAVDISGYTITDAGDNRVPTTVFTVPSGTMLGANEFRGFFHPQTGIILDSIDAVELRDATGSLQDSFAFDIEADGLQPTSSYGRLTNGTGDWRICLDPNPDESNVTANCGDALAISLSSVGAISSPQTLSLVLLLVGAVSTSILSYYRRN